MATATEHDLIEEKILEVQQRDRRFARNAYFFVLDGLDHTMARLGRDAHTGEDRHVGARELLEGLRDHAAELFGPLATLVFARWGVHGSEDFGEIVFNLIDAGLLSRRDSDSRLDFSDGVDFDRAFADKHREQLARIREHRS